MAGLEVEEIHYVGLPMPERGPEGRQETKITGISWASDKIVVGAILEVMPHPHADRLVLCRLVDGTGEQIVLTGASNLYSYKGRGALDRPIKVAYAREGAQIYDGHQPGQVLATLKRARIPRGGLVFDGLLGERAGHFGRARGHHLPGRECITKSVHALHVGTERLRSGDFAHQIPSGSRDQLGDLAESFNVMARGIQGLLREQAEKERLEEELRMARQIQMSLLPGEGLVRLPGVRIAALCLPAAEVGGDYYDLLPLGPTRMGVLVSDVSGKGTSAALYMAELKGLVLSLSRIHDSPARLLCEANRILSAHMDSRSFVTMTYAIVDTVARRMRYARAGHNPLIHLQARTGKTHVLTPPGLGLGLDAGERFESILEEGDFFLFFTDGLSEAMNSGAELFGEGRLRTILEHGEGLSSEELKQRILEDVHRFVGEATQADDMTLVVLKVVGEDRAA